MANIEIKDDAFKKWIDDLYNPALINDDGLAAFKERFEYHGFDRNQVVQSLYAKFKDPQIAIQLIIVTALRGPQAASKIQLMNGKTPKELGIEINGGKGSNKLTLNKIVASTADLAAFYLKRMKVKPRIISELPAWLQFPSAGSIKMSDNLRDLHREFSKKFSKAIGGEFNESIYDQMTINAYIDPKLKIFQ